MVQREHVFLVPKGYSPLVGCRIKGNVVIIAQYGGGGARPSAPPSLPSNMLLTEASNSILQEDGHFLLLDGYN